MLELTSGIFGFLLVGELIIGLTAIGCFLDENKAYGFSLFLFVVGLIVPIALFKDLTLSQTFQYLPYYGGGAVGWFFLKWVLTLWRVGSELKEVKKEDLKYNMNVKQNKDGSYSMVQPEFFYLLSHAIAFPYSIIATFFDTVLLNLYNLFKLQMQKLADAFLPKELR